MCVQYINVCLRKKLIAASACCGCRLWWRWSVVVVVFRVEYFLVFRVITLNSEKKHLHRRTTTTAPLPRSLYPEPRILFPVSLNPNPRSLSQCFAESELTAHVSVNPSYWNRDTGYRDQRKPACIDAKRVLITVG